MMERKFKALIKRNDKWVYEFHDPKHIITGDTDSSHIDLAKIFSKDSPKSDVVTLADELGARINQQFPDFMQTVFNVPSDRLSIINTKRECVADKALFLVKKKYAMHVVNKEGIDEKNLKESDKLKIMGMEIKKTDTAPIVQDFLKQLVIDLMDNKSIEHITKSIEDFKATFIGSSMQVIGKPMGIRTLNKYIQLYQNTESMYKFPYQARSSIFYNNLCTIQDRKIYEGDKIKIIYLKHPEYKYIAIPAESEVLPKFLDDFEIDWDVMWSKVLQKIKLYLNPVGLDYNEDDK